MDSEISTVIDLFGEVVPAGRGKRGRPAHQWTVENSNKINLLFATGHEPEDAARMLGISMPTLRKHYFFELERYDAARLRLKGKLLNGLMAEADKGNVAAAKELFKQAERGQLVPAKVKPAKVARIGKKEQAAIDAKSVPAASSWGDLMGPPPDLVN